MTNEQKSDDSGNKMTSDYFRLKAAIMDKALLGSTVSLLLVILIWLIVELSSLLFFYGYLIIIILPSIIIRIQTQSRKSEFFSSLENHTSEMIKAQEKDIETKYVRYLGYLLILSFTIIMLFIIYLNRQIFDKETQEPFSQISSFELPYDLLLLTLGLILFFSMIINRLIKQEVEERI